MQMVLRTFSIGLAGAAAAVGATAAEPPRQLEPEARVQPSAEAMEAYSGGDPRRAREILLSELERCEARDDLAPDGCYELVYYELSSALYLNRLEDVASRADAWSDEILALYGPANEDRAYAMSLLAIAHKNLGRLAEAENFYRLASELNRELRGADSDDYAAALNNQAVLENLRGRHRRSEELAREAHSIWAANNGEQSHQAALGLGAIARSLDHQGRLVEAADHIRKALDATAGRLSPKHIDLAIWHNNYASALRRLGDYATAEEHILKAYAIGLDRYGPDHETVVTNEAQLALIYFHSGRRTQAIETLESALGRDIRRGSALQAALLITATNLASRMKDRVGEWRYLREALALVEEGAGVSPDMRAELHARAANLYVREGDFANAREHLGAADRFVSDETEASLLASLAQVRGAMAMVLGDAASARAEFAREEALLRTLLPEHHARVVNALHDQARAAAGGDLPDLEEAARFHAIARPLAVRNLADQIASGGDGASEGDFHRDLFYDELDILVRARENGDPANNSLMLRRAFEVAQLAAQNSAARAASGALIRHAHADNEIGGLVARRIATFRELQAQEEALREARRTDAGQDELAALISGIGTSRQRYNLETDTLDALAPGLSGSDVLRPVSLEQAQAALPPNSLLVMVVEVDQSKVSGRSHRYHIFAVSRETAQWRTLSGARATEVSQAIADIRAAMTTPSAAPTRGNAATFAAGLTDLRAVRNAGETVGGHVLADVALAGINRVYAVLNGSLATIPLALLRPDGAEGGWLIDRHEILRLPSVASVMAPQPAQVVRQDFILALGATENATVDLPPLIHARRQLDAIASVPGATVQVHSGPDASEERLATTLARTIPSTLVFATHTLAPSRVSGLAEPALMLHPDTSQDGLLTTTEIAQLELPGTFVVLTACNTAMPTAVEADPLASFARAFFAAGASGMLVSHWPIDDAGTEVLMREYMKLRAARPEAGEAAILRSAALAMRGDANSRWTHPRYWAAFSAVSRAVEIDEINTANATDFTNGFVR